MARGNFKDHRIIVQCEACDQPFTTPKRGAHWTRPPARFCSLYCRDYIAHNREWWCTWTPPKPKSTRPKPTPHQHLSHCNWCGIDMNTVSSQRYRYCRPLHMDRFDPTMAPLRQAVRLLPAAVVLTGHAS